MTNKLIRPLISCLLIIALLVPAVAQAMPAAPAGQPTWPAEPLRDDAGPAWPQANGASGADSSSPTDSAAPNKPVGRLLLSPAIDADGDPLTNPAGDVPVARVGGKDRSKDVLYAEVSLAAEVLPDDPQRNPAGATVTFRVWHESDPVEIVRAARADAWGAAATSILFDDLHLAGRWFYQASAPGYGETPLRSFNFDSSSYSSEVRLDAVHITTQIAEDGRLVVNIESDVEIDPSAEAASLLAVALIPTSIAPSEPERIVLPPLPVLRLSNHRARSEVFLEEGSYLFMAQTQSGAILAQSAPLLVQIPATTIPPPATIEDIYETDADDDTVLVRYRTPDGASAIARQGKDEVAASVEGAQPATFTDSRRIGAFQWQVDSYTIATEVVTDDGKKIVRIDGFSYDPIARRYDIVVESLMDEPVEDKLTVQVFGPGDVLILEETTPIWLDPDAPLRHSVTVPSDLGEPYGLRIIVHDPSIVDAIIKTGEYVLTGIFNTLVGGKNPESGLSLTVSHTISLTVAQLSLLTWQLSCAIGGGCTVPPPGGVIGDWLAGSSTDWLDVTTTALRDFMRAAGFSSLEAALKAVENGIPVGSFSWLWSISERLAVTIYDDSCSNPITRQQARDAADKYGTKLGSMASSLNETFGRLLAKLTASGPEPIPFPAPVSFLAKQITPEVKPEFTGGRAGDYSVFAALEMKFGWKASILAKAPNVWAYIRAVKYWGEFMVNMWRLSDRFVEINQWYNVVREARNLHFAKKQCKSPLPNGRPDDRRDASTTDFLAEPTGVSGDVQYLQQQVASAQQLGLARAETFWTLRLRRAEYNETAMDMTLSLSEILDQQAVLIETDLQLNGLIDETILPPPGQTITDAVASIYEGFFASITDTERSRILQEHRDAVDFAQRQYNLLHGQELALQQELRTQLAWAGVGVLDSGLVTWALTAMSSLGVNAVPVQILANSSISGLRDSRYYTPFEAPSVLLVPSGGFYRYGASQEARAWLDTYVNLGGTLIVLAQANGQDWDLLPGGEVEGLGFEEDILCKTASVRIVNSSPWIKGIGRDLPDIQIDGSFTSWPADATVVLLRTTGNQMPAMIEYDYGAGHVVAMSAYPDFYINGMQSLEDIVFARSLFGLAYLEATGQSVAATASAPGAPVNLPVPVTNNMALDATEMTVMHDYYRAHVGEAWRWAAHRPRPLQGSTVVDLAPDLPSGDATTVNVSFTTPPQAGIFRSGYFLGSPGDTAYVPSAWYRSGGITGPFYEVQSAYTPPPGLSVRSNQDRYAFGELAEITVAVHNNQPIARAFELQPLAGLDAPPVALPVGPNASAQHIFTTRVYGRTTVRIGLAENSALLSEAPLTLRLSPPFLGLEAAAERLPAGLATSVAVTATLVDGRASQMAWEARLDGALVDSTTTPLTPSGAYSVTTASLSLPAATAGDKVTINARLIGASGAMTQTLPVLAPFRLDGVALSAPLAIGRANADAVRVRVDDTGFPGSADLRALVRRNGDLVVSAAGPWQAIPLGGGSQLVDLDLPLPAVLDASQGYSVVVEATGQVVGGDPINASRLLPLPAIDLDMVLLNASRVVRQPLGLRIFPPTGRAEIVPTAPYTVTVAATEGAPWSVSVVVTQTQPFDPFVLELPTPSAPAGGRYQVSVQSPGLANWIASDELSIPVHQLRYSAPDSVAAGQSLVWTASNNGGVDTTLDGSLILLDGDGVKVAQATVSNAIPVGATLAVALDAPQQLRSGAYRLRWSGVDHLSIPVRDERVLAVAGLEVELASQTDQQAYLTGQTVTALSTITSSAALEDAQLRLRIASRGGNPYIGDYGEPGVIAATVAGGLRDGAAVGRALRLDRVASVSFLPSGDDALVADGRVIHQVDTATWAGHVVAGRTGMGNSAVDNVGLNARFAADLMSVSLSGDGSFAILVEFGRGIIRRYDTATGLVSYVTGGGGGCTDGVGSAARFNFPGQSAVSHDGSFALVTDACGLRYIDLTTSTVTTLVPGLTGGVAISPGDSYALVAFPNAHTVNLVTLPGGANVVLAGTAFSSGSADGVGAAARFNSPNAVAISADETFALVGDTGNDTVRRISLPGAAVTTLAGAAGQSGFADGVGSAARFAALRHVAISPDDDYALLTDGENQAVRRLDLASNAVTTPLGNWPGADGVGNEARFVDPWDVAVSADGSFALIANASGATIKRMDLATGMVTTIAGAFEQQATVDGVGPAARFYWPSGVAISPDNATALVVDDTHHVVRRIDLSTLQVTTIAGSPNQSGFVNGVGAAARFNAPADVVFSPDGSYALVADWGSNAVRKLDLATAEVMTFVAPGTGGLDDPRAIDISPDGSYALVGGVADCAIFRVDISGGAATGVTQIAGSGYCDPEDGVGLDASFDSPDGVAISPDGSVALVSERFATVVRRIDLATLEVTTVAGAAFEDSTSRDGPGAAARIYQPIGIDFGPDGTWALTTSQLGYALVRLDLATVAKAQVQTVINRPPDSDGDGPAARLYYPSAIALSADGTFAVVADSGNNAIRLLSLISPERATEAARLSGARSNAASAAAPTRQSHRSRSAEAPAYPALHLLSRSETDEHAGNPAARPQPRQPERPSRANPVPVAPAGAAHQPAAPAIDLPNVAYLSTLAGHSGEWGDDDGVGSMARFNWPEGVAISPDNGFVLVGDSANHTIRRVDLGSAAVTTVAGQSGSAGGADGSGAAARFNYPSGIAFSPDGSFALIADAGNHTIRRLIVASGAVTTIAGQAGAAGSADGVGSAARFNSPRAVAISADGSFALVADYWNNTVRRIDLLSNSVTTLAGQPGVSGSDDGIGGAATFSNPGSVSLSVDGSSALVTDADSNLLRHIDVATGLVTTVAGEPWACCTLDGVGSAARFKWPLAVALSANGQWALVADNDSGTVRYVDVPSGEVATLLSLPLHQDGSGHDVRLNWPMGLDLNADGSVAVVADSASNTIRRLDVASGEVTTVAGEANAWGGSADGVGNLARFNSPRDVALDGAGMAAYVADSGNQTIRHVDLLSGAVTTVAGSPNQSGSANGVGSAARFQAPQGIALSPDETFLLIADTNNHTIRRLDLATYQVTTVAGSAGVSGVADGVGSAARFNQPQGIAINADGSYALIADTYNQMIRRLDLATGRVTRFAGWPGWSGSLDGLLDSAYFSYPRGVSISADGSYALVADGGSGLLRRIELSGPDAHVVTTVAGSPWRYREVDGIGSAARFYWAVDVAMSDDPTFALALDAEAMTVRRVGLPGAGVAPATLLRQEWQAVDGQRASDAIELSLSFIDPNLLEDGRARGQLYLEADLWSRDPSSQPLAGLRHRLASASHPFVVEDAVDGLALFAGPPLYRRNVAGYTPDDAESAVQLGGVLRNTDAGPAAIDLTITRSDGATVLTRSFPNVPADHSRSFRVADPAPPLGTVSYTAATSLGHSETVTITILAASVSAQASVDPDNIALGEATTLQLDLVNSGQLPAFVTAHLLAGPMDLRLEPGQAISLTQVMTPTVAGTPSLSVALSGDLSAPATAAVQVRDETAQVGIELLGVVRPVRAAGPDDDPQLVLSDDAGLAIHLSNSQSFSFPALVTYSIAGAAVVTGSQALILDPGVAEIVVPLATAPAGGYSASVTVYHGRLGHALASAMLDFELVAPVYNLAVAVTLTPELSLRAVTLGFTESSTGSDLPWQGVLRWRGAAEGEQPTSLTPGASQSTSVTLDLSDRVGGQEVIVELVAADGSVLASRTVTVQGEPRAAPAAALDAVTVSPAAAGGGLTVTAALSNSGPTGEALLEVIAFDQVIELIGEVAGASSLRAPAASTVLSLTVPVPPDLLAGSYPVIVRLGDQEQRVEAVISGAEIDLRQWLDADVYQPNTMATWTVELEGLAGAPAQYDVELRYGDQAHTQTVTVGAGQTVQAPWTFEVGPVSDRGTVLVQTHPLSAEQTRHSLIIDSQWIPVQEDVRAWLETDKGRYQAGETVHLTYHLETPMQSAMVLEPNGLLGEPGPLVWSSLQVSPTAALTYTVTITDPVSGNPVNQTVVLTETNWLQGDFPFSYELPTVLATGRYFFRYFFGGEERTLPVDVFGVDLKVTEFAIAGPGVDAGRAAQAGGPVAAAATLRLNVPLASARLSLFGVGPDGEYLDLGATAVMTMPLPAGDTAIALNGVLAPEQPGPHQLVLKVNDAASLAELGGEAAIFGVGRAGISSLFTDQGTYLPGEAGTGELTVYGVGPTTVVVTATNGSTLLSSMITLDGFERFDFAIPTANHGDYLLVARTVDAAGMVDSALRAYAVPLPPDTEPPVLTVTNPSTHTILYSAAPTMTLTVQGLVSDDRGPVTVYVDGRPATVLADSGWHAPVTLRRGSNAISAVALDDAGNFTTAPLIDVILTPQGAVSHAPDRASAIVGEQLTFQSTIQATATISNAQLIQFLPPGRAASVTAGASSGQVLGIAEGPDGVFVHWQGDVGSAPVTVAMTVTLTSAGVLTSTATAFWGWGLNDQATAQPVQVNSPLAVVLNGFAASCQAGAPLIAWETLSEIDHLGFHLYRGPTPEGWDTQINGELIPAQNPGGTGGAWYQWHDLTAPAGQELFYWLEDVSLSGVATMHGPVSVLCLPPTAVALSGLEAGPPAGAVPWWLLVLAAVLGGLGAARRRR